MTLNYYDGEQTEAKWLVRPLAEEKRAKNVIFFIGECLECGISPTAADVLEGDGMTTNMITAARLLGHKSINGRYQSTMQLDKFPVLGHQMTHSIDSCMYKSTHGTLLGP